MTREEAKEEIRLLGGEISESVSKKTDYVIAGTKFKKSKKIGVKILSEQELLKMLQK